MLLHIEIFEKISFFIKIWNALLQILSSLPICPKNQGARYRGKIVYITLQKIKISQKYLVKLDIQKQKMSTCHFDTEEKRCQIGNQRRNFRAQDLYQTSNWCSFINNSASAASPALFQAARAQTIASEKYIQLNSLKYTGEAPHYRSLNMEKFL